MPSAFDDDLSPQQTRRSLYDLSIGLIIGCAIIGGGVVGGSYLMTSPAPPDKVARFQQVYKVRLTQDQTLSAFRQEDPVTHQLQQQAVDAVLWEMVAQAARLNQSIAADEAEKKKLMDYHPSVLDDPEFARITQQVKVIDQRMAQKATEARKIQVQWGEDLRLAEACRFTDSGARDFYDAMQKYLRSQGLSSKGGGPFFYVVRYTRR